MKKILVLVMLYFALCPLAIQAAETANTAANRTLLQRVENWYEHNMGYGAITVLMAVESSFIPFPSEIVVPPAAYIASKPDSDLNIFLVVLFATLGAVVGALINYALAMWLGRPLIYRLADSRVGHLLLLSREKIEKAEQYFNHHGKVSTFVGRLIPAIRQLISIPAGLARMNIGAFIAFTVFGAGVWNGVLALIGYIAHGQADLINRYSHELSVVLLALFGMGIAWIVIKNLIKRKKKHTTRQK